MLICVTPVTYAGPLRLQGEAAIGYDSNVANARQGGDEREDGFAEIDLSMSKMIWDLDAHNALQARFGVDTQGFSRSEGLDSAKASLQLRYLLRPGSSFYTPTLALSGSAAWWEFDSALRDSAEYRAGLFIAEQLTTRISARLSGNLDWRQSRGEVFDLRTRTAGVDLDWALTHRFAIYAGFQRRWGQFVTTRPTAPPLPAVFAPDDAFDGEFATRLDGDANITTAGMNFAFTQWLALDVQGTFVEAGATSGLHYRRTQAVASLLARF